VSKLKTTNKKSAFNELTSFKTLIVKFQASTLDQCHHLLISLSCKSASEPLNAQYFTWAGSHRGRHYDCACYALFTRFWYTTTQHVHRSRAASLLWGTDNRSKPSTKLSRI